MKARVRATGDIYNVIDMNDYRNRFKLEDHNWYTMGEIELIEGNEPDWQQVRIQAAIAAMQGLISGGIYTSSTIRLAKERGQSGTEFIAQMATEFADDLIAELQKEGGQDG